MSDGPEPLTSVPDDVEYGISATQLAYGGGTDLQDRNRAWRVERGNVFYRAGSAVSQTAKFKGAPIYGKARVQSLTSQGYVDPSTGLAAKGSTVKNLATPNFTFAANTPNQLVISWGAYATLRPDGTAIQLAAVPVMASNPKINYSQGQIQIDGLTANTLYYFHPYWSENFKGIGFVSGGTGVGTPKAAFTSILFLNVQQQTLFSNFSFGIISFTMPASGSSSGTSGGGAPSGGVITNSPPTGGGGRPNIN